MKISAFALAVALATSPCIAQMQDNVRVDEQIALKQMETNQRSIYALNLGLTDQESRDFWPVYDQYEAAIKKVTNQRVELLNRYAEKYQTLSGEDATEMLGTIWKCEREALRIREKYAAAVQKVLPSVKALRYVQLQARIDNLLLGRFMSLVPLATEQNPRSTD